MRDRTCLAFDCECDISHMARQARFCTEACRKRHARGHDTEDHKSLVSQGIPDVGRPTQMPRLSTVQIARLERRLDELTTLETIMEADDNLVGKSSRGRVGTSMRGQGGILLWARPLYRQ